MFKLLAPNAQVQKAHWTIQLLGHLDWHRFHELVARLLHRAGYVPEVAWIRPDGGTAMTLVHPTRPHQLEAVVQCPAWLCRETDSSALQSLLQVVKDERAQRGIFITSGVFSESARAFAELKRLELIDGSDLLGTLLRMPEEERDYFLRMATTGPYLIPTCPSCTRKMELVDDSAAGLGQRQRDVVYKDRRFEQKEVDCQSLTLRKRAEVSFLQNVTAATMTVHGKAMGNFVINGRLHIAAGGCISGLVSARAIQLDSGGTMDAEALILNKLELSPLQPRTLRQIWRCPGNPKCRTTLPAR